MKISVTHLLLVAVCSLPLFLLAACSVREDIDECTQYALTVKAVDAQGNDMTAALTSVELYLFDPSGFVRRVPAGSSTDFLFAHNKDSAVTLIAWGNVKADSLEMPEIAAGTPVEQAQLLLLRNEQGYNLPIPDLFYSRQVIEPGERKSNTRGISEETLTLTLARCAAGISIRTRNLNNHDDAQDSPCYFVVRGNTTAVNFLGEPIDSRAGYVPFSVVDAEGDLYAPPFRIFPTQEAQQHTRIDIMQGDNTLYTITKDSQGNPLHALPGQQLNVEVELSFATIQVTVTVVPWGEVNQDVEM